MAVVVLFFLEHVQVYAVHLYGYNNISMIIIKSALFIPGMTPIGSDCVEDVYNNVRVYPVGSTRDSSCQVLAVIVGKSTLTLILGMNCNFMVQLLNLRESFNNLSVT